MFQTSSQIPLIFYLLFSLTLLILDTSALSDATNPLPANQPDATNPLLTVQPESTGIPNDVQSNTTDPLPTVQSDATDHIPAFKPDSVVTRNALWKCLGRLTPLHLPDPSFYSVLFPSAAALSPHFLVSQALLG